MIALVEPSAALDEMPVRPKPMFFALDDRLADSFRQPGVGNHAEIRDFGEATS